MNKGQLKVTKFVREVNTLENQDPFNDVIQTEEELRDITGHPSKLVTNKVIHFLDHHCIDIISKSPFITLSTSDDKGYCDGSPRGDYPGFVQVIDERKLVIPERPGNRRMDSIRNILSNPRIGILFMIPGLEETLRINGKASVTHDDDFLEKMAYKGKKPVLGIGVVVEECLIHCAKSFKRAHLWEPPFWAEKETLPKAAKILVEHAKLLNVDEKEMNNQLQESYRKGLY